MSHRVLPQVILLLLITSSFVCQNAPAEERPSVTAASETPGTTNPTAVPTVQWLSKSAAKTSPAVGDPSTMQAYDQQISGTEVSFAMVPIAGGEFLMGSPDGEPGRAEDEGPQHRVRVEPFWMGKYEVTWDEFELWSGSIERQQREQAGTKANAGDQLAEAITRPTKPHTDLTFEMGKSGYPAICMTQLAAKCYCKWLSAKTGRYYRLPTEAEWEYACRAGTTTAYSFGDDADQLDAHGWYFDNGDDRYHKVGSKQPNPWGLFDMHGNVSEWVLDGHTADYSAFTQPVTLNPFVPPSDVFSRVARGGCWDDDPEDLRSAARKVSEAKWNKDDPRQPQSIWYHTDMTCPGFRVVRPLRTPTAEESAGYEPSWAAIQAYSERQTRTP